MKNILEQIAKDNEPYPRFVKWRRGRPTKAMKAEREAFQKKFAENSHICRLLKDAPHPIKNENGEYVIKYIPRNTE